MPRLPFATYSAFSSHLSFKDLRPAKPYENHSAPGKAELVTLSPLISARDLSAGNLTDYPGIWKSHRSANRIRDRFSQ